MPLSEHEQRQLEQIEQALYREDRRLARLVRSSDPRVHYRRRVVEALFGLALGAGMIAAGIIVTVIGLAVAGFVVLLLSGIWALNSWRQMSTVTVAQDGGPRAQAVKRRSRRKRGRGGLRTAGPARGSLSERIDERWRRRQEGDL